MAASNDVISSTLQKFVKQMVFDGFYETSPLVDLYISMGKRVERDGGQSLVAPIIASQGGVITKLSTGNESVPLTVSEVLKQPSFNWAHAATNIVVSKKDLLENQGDSAKIKIIEARVKSRMQLMMSELNSWIVGGTGSGDGFSDLTSFNGLATASNGSTTGIFEDRAFGGQTNTVGGVAKSSYTSSWQHQHATAGGDFSANGRRQLDILIEDCKRQSPEGSYPHAILMSRAGFHNLKALIDANERFVKEGDERKAGFKNFTYCGIPIVRETDMPGGPTVDAYLDAEQEATAFVINMDHIQLNTIRDAWFKLEPWTDLIAAGYAGQGCRLYTSAAVTVDHLPSSGLLTAGDTN